MREKPLRATVSLFELTAVQCHAANEGHVHCENLGYDVQRCFIQYFKTVLFIAGIFL